MRLNMDVKDDTCCVTASHETGVMVSVSGPAEQMWTLMQEALNALDAELIRHYGPARGEDVER